MTWKLYIDWDRNNDFTSTYDDVTNDVHNDSPVEWFLGCRPFQSIADESTLKFTLYNQNQRYSPENSASPLYGKLMPNLPVRLMYSSVIMWTGITRHFKPTPFKMGKNVCLVECIGLKEILTKTKLYVPLYTNTTADAVIQDIVLGIASPPGIAGKWRLGVSTYSELGTTTRLGSLSDIAVLDVGVMTFSFVGDNAQQGGNNSAYQIIKDLCDAEGGKFLVDRQGRGMFWNQNHLADDTSIELTIDSQAQSLEYATPTEDLINSVEVTCYPRQQSATNTEILWQLTDPLTVKPGDTQIITVPYQFNNKEVGATDLQAPTGGDLVFSSGSASVSVASLGERATITLINSDVVDAVVSTMVLRGRVLDSKFPIVKIARDDASIRRYGLYSRPMQLKALDDPDQAQDVADRELGQRSGVLGRISSITDYHQISATTDEQIARSLGDMIRIKDVQLAHDRCYQIVGEKHSLDVKNKILNTTWMLEPALLRLAYYGRLNQDVGVNLQGSDANLKLAQSFQPSASAKVGSIRLWLKKVGVPTGNLTIKLYADYSVPSPWILGRVGSSELGTKTILGTEISYPSSTLITNGTSDVLNASVLGAGYKWIRFTFTTPPSVAAATTYWIVIETTDGSSASNYVVWGADGSSPSYASGEMKSYIASWKQELKDACFEVYAAALT